MGYGSGDDSRGFGGGPGYTEGPPVDGWHGQIPGTAPWRPIIPQKQYVRLGGGRVGPPTNYAQGPAAGPHLHWWDDVKNVHVKPGDARKNVQRIQKVPRPGNIVPYVAPGVKVTDRKKQ
jgi:hypothetical protein